MEGRVSGSQSSFANTVLSRLLPDDFHSLSSGLESVDLPVQMCLQGRNRRIESVYFPECGIASVVANGNLAPIEVGIIGREGMTGLPIYCGVDHSPTEIFMQVAGKGWRVSTSDLRQCLHDSSTMRQSVGQAMHLLTVQTAQTAATYGRSKINERLARWLLMAQDRLQSEHLPLTHEFLSMMLGIRRAGVTVSLHTMVDRGLITLTRKDIVIADRKGLVGAAKGTYGIVEAEQTRVSRLKIVDFSQSQVTPTAN
jgi:CRP-like cAMP-binding protein